ncbi:hypothetical protein FIBSPDRAFT_894523 [Athelia psychrophila]|uniref:Uncharacterized protein n=1 Tax=Athelia psychrophila TaxID=1759441 RepID=A0A166FSN0_9AGAM|nr:hypothetical protein FIBSPDRAFT_894523 [Fibularhizoctonia sp. CBS 109695]
MLARPQLLSPRQRHPHLASDIPILSERPSKEQAYVTYMEHSVSANDGHLVRARRGMGRAEKSSSWMGGLGTEVAGARHGGGETVLADREDMRVMVATLVCNGDTDEERKYSTARVCVDTARGLPYWTQKTLYAHLPEPIDLELDTTSRTLYWTDRGDPPLGNTLNRTDDGRLRPPRTQHQWCQWRRSSEGADRRYSRGGQVPRGDRAVARPLRAPRVRRGSEWVRGRKEVLIEDAGTVTGIVYCEARGGSEAKLEATSWVLKCHLRYTTVFASIPRFKYMCRKNYNL